MGGMEKPGIYLGLMSGTSVDAIDASAVRFSSNQDIDFLACHTHEIPTAIKQKIIELNHPDSNELHRTMSLDMELGKLFAEATKTLLKKSKLNSEEIIAIGSHGQTIRHQIESEPHYTLQIGNPNIIAELTKITTIADFRSRDIVVGGQGAPLVPAFHQALFKHETEDRIILNVGGMANLTFLWANKNTEGFDTGPGNVLMDYWFNKNQNGAFDTNGEWASTGKPNPDLLKKLLQDKYFSQSPPKSTGRELFDAHWLEGHIKSTNDSPENIQATLLNLTVESISNAVESWGPKPCEVFVCGGGANNNFLMENLAKRLPNYEIASTEKLGLKPNWVEACAFAWLAKRCLEGKPGSLPSVTGASKETVLGAIYPA